MVLVVQLPAKPGSGNLRSHRRNETHELVTVTRRYLNAAGLAVAARIGRGMEFRVA